MALLLNISSVAKNIVQVFYISYNLCIYLLILIGVIFKICQQKHPTKEGTPRPLPQKNILEIYNNV